MTILAIDQGTTSSRCLLWSPSGKSRIVAAIEHEQSFPQPGWVEHDPEELLENIEQCIRAGIRACLRSGEELIAIGIDNQGESCLAWNRDTKKAITPVIVWQDNRTSRFIEQLKADNRESMVLAKTGLPLDAYFSAAKLGWILRNIPEAAALLEQGKLRMGTTDAFFLDRLTGCCVTDISTASRTSLMDINSGQWDEELGSLFGVSINALPEIISTTADFGNVIIDDHSIPVTANIVDQQAALYGHGCQKTGEVKITFGTGAFALMVTGNTVYQAAEQGLLPTVAWQFQGEKPVYALDGGVFSAGSAINWAKSLGLFSSFEEIQQFDHSPAIGRDLVFVPALSGLGCPHWDRKAAGMWLGLALDTRPMDLVQSILEGIVFRAAEVIAAMDQLVPVQEVISIDGGLSANPYFCQFLADVLQRQVVVQESAELTALGTARLAAGIGLDPVQQEKNLQRYEPEVDRKQDLLCFKEALKKTIHWRK
jgi:glycerol kinase